MFRWTSHNASGEKVEGSKDIDVGNWVRSRYRAPWKGTIDQLNSNGGTANITILIDRHNNPLRKPKKTSLHVD